MTPKPRARLNRDVGMPRDLMFPKRHTPPNNASTYPKPRRRMRKPPLPQCVKNARRRLLSQLDRLATANKRGVWLTERDVPEVARMVATAVAFVKQGNRKTSPRAFTYHDAQLRFGLLYSNIGRVIVTDLKTGTHLAASEYGAL